MRIAKPTPQSQPAAQPTPQSWLKQIHEPNPGTAPVAGRQRRRYTAAEAVAIFGSTDYVHYR
jgi:hypothetical protein